MAGPAACKLGGDFHQVDQYTKRAVLRCGGKKKRKEKRRKEKASKFVALGRTEAKVESKYR